MEKHTYETNCLTLDGGKEEGRREKGREKEKRKKVKTKGRSEVYIVSLQEAGKKDF